MDARVTKQRLSNMLSYDWIKILVVIVAAVTALTVFFTMVRTRPGQNQVFEVYGYTDLKAGTDANYFADRLKSGNVFSYDILDVESETFDASGYYGATTYMARRSAQQGKVMFTTVRTTGNEADPEETFLETAAGAGERSIALALDVYFEDCRSYLVRFFGEDWEHDPLNKAEAEQCFLRRNGKDKRYNYGYAGNLGRGIEDEYARLEKLRADFAFVRDCFEEDVLTCVDLRGGDGQPRAILLKGLTRITSLYYYTETAEDGASVAVAEKLCLFLFDNNDKDIGRPASQVVNDLRYEPVSFLRYLVETYR